MSEFKDAHLETPLKPPDGLVRALAEKGLRRAARRLGATDVETDAVLEAVGFR